MRKLLLLSLFIIPSSFCAQTATFELINDATFTQRAGTMTAGFKTLYVRIVPYPLAPPGYAGLEFRLSGLEDLLVVATDWTAQPVVALGTLANGMNVSWPNCQYNELVMTFTMYSMDPPVDRQIRVAAHTNPQNPNLAFPYLNNCEAPCIFCGNPLEGEAYVLNPTVAVEDTRWSRIKELYR